MHRVSEACEYSRLLCRRVMLSSLADLCREHTTGTPWNVVSKNVLQDSGLVLLWGQFHSHSKKDKDRCNRILRLQYDLVLNQSKYLQKILMAVITCQGGVMIHNCYNCMLMFACTFYNGSSAKKSHSATNKSHFFSFEGKSNLTIDFGNITLHMKLTHFCSYTFTILVFLHRNATLS